MGLYPWPVNHDLGPFGKMSRSNKAREQRALHVGQFIDSLDPGGAESMVIDLALGLRKRGMRVTIFHFGNPWLAEQVRSAGLTDVVLDRRFYRSIASLPIFVLRFSALLRKHGIDVVHCHLLGAIFAAALAGRVAGIPVIGTIHDVYSIHDSRWNRLYLKWAQKTGCRLISVCDAMRDEVTRTCKLKPIDRIYNGIDVNRYNTGTMRTHSNARVQIICVARAVPVKRIDRLLYSVAKLDPTVPLELKIVGDGPSLPALTELARDLGIFGKVSFVGHRSDIPALLEDSDIFALVSDSEGFSVSILESMASGLPSVVTDVGGNRELVVDGESGYVVQKSDEIMLRRRIVELVENEEIRSEFGNAARNRVKRKFGLSMMCDAYASTIKSMRVQRA